MDENKIRAMIRKMNIKERVDGRYEGRLTLDNGKRKSFYGTTKVEVKNKVHEYLSKVENGYVESSVLLDSYADYWLTKYKYTKIEDSSYARLRNAYENIISPELGWRKISDITTQSIQALVDNRANPPKGSNIRPLSYSSLKKILEFLRPCLRCAVKEGVISKNPCDDVVLPRQNSIVTETKEQFALSDQQIALFKEAALQKTRRGDYRRDGIVLLLILSTGVRVGEAVALEWEDLCIESKEIHINKTIQSNIKNYHDSSKPKRYDKLKRSTKTKAGVRVNPINESVEELITLLREYDKRNAISSPYVACTLTGNRNNARNLQRSLDRILNGVDMGSLAHKVTLHTLRHTFGSVMLRRGVPISVVSALMGHSSVTVTYNKYIHVLQDEKVTAVSKVNIV